MTPRMSAGYPSQKLPLWADFSFLIQVAPCNCKGKKKNNRLNFFVAQDGHFVGHTPNTAGTFRKEFREKQNRKRSQSVSWNSSREHGWLRAFPGIPLESMDGIPQAL